MSTEVIYSDGSLSQFADHGATVHSGAAAIQRIRLIAAASALRVYIESGGKWQMTRNGAQRAIVNVIQPLTGKTYKRSMNGKREAFADCQELIYLIERDAVIVEEWSDDVEPA